LPQGVVEFGWVVGIPEQVETNSYFHVKYASDRSEPPRPGRRRRISGANVGQAIFTDPASSVLTP
jgi:CRISPR-associated protein Cst2